MDDETVNSLDSHLFLGDEVRDVYAEITKFMKKDYLDFDKVIDDKSSGHTLITE